MQVQQFVLECATLRAGKLEAVAEALEGRELGLGVVNPRTALIETPEQIMALAREALRYAPAGRICTREVWLHTPLLWVPLQLVALRLSQEQKAKALRRKRKKATQDKSRVSAQAAYGAGWVLVVSTLPAAEWNAAQLLTRYRSRWHI